MEGRKFYVEKFEIGKIPFKLESNNGIWKIYFCKCEVPVKLESLTEVGNFSTSIDTSRLQ